MALVVYFTLSSISGTGIVLVFLGVSGFIMGVQNTRGILFCFRLYPLLFWLLPQGARACIHTYPGGNSSSIIISGVLSGGGGAL
ncbi:hypothetical protein F5B20DRAFT_320816 [Whalleya microplaca]|nr:hypothetical protein F5B20DRAFT_320816 [Whalleya microplaca]